MDPRHGIGDVALLRELGIQCLHGPGGDLVDAHVAQVPPDYVDLAAVLGGRTRGDEPVGLHLVDALQHEVADPWGVVLPLLLQQVAHDSLALQLLADVALLPLGGALARRAEVPGHVLAHLPVVLVASVVAEPRLTAVAVDVPSRALRVLRHDMPPVCCGVVAGPDGPRQESGVPKLGSAEMPPRWIPFLDGLSSPRIHLRIHLGGVN